MGWFIEKHRQKLGIAGSLFAIVISITYLFVVPEQANQTEGIKLIIIRFAHSACWFILAIASILYAFRRSVKAIQTLAGLALMLYLAFMFSILF